MDLHHCWQHARGGAFAQCAEVLQIDHSSLGVDPGKMPVLPLPLDVTTHGKCGLLYAARVGPLFFEVSHEGSHSP